MRALDCGFRLTTSTLDLALGGAFGLGDLLVHFGLSNRQLIASAFGFGDRLGLLRNRLFDRGSKPRLANKAKLLDAYAHRRNLLLNTIASFTQKPRLVLAVNVLECVGR